MKIEIRDLHKVEPEDYPKETFDILVTTCSGIAHQSPDVYGSAAKAQEALNELFSKWDIVLEP